MTNEQIISIVNETIGQLIKEFKGHPTLFYTENDILLFFYSLLQKNANYPKQKDINNNEHFLIHTEYPTPSKVDMSNNKCDEKPDDSRYKRGHYDLIVLNPEFIEQYPYEIIKGQNFKEYKKAYKKYSGSPIVLFALELMFSRDPLNSREAEEAFWAKTIQDANKLKLFMGKFIGNARMLAFIKGTSKERCPYINKELLECKDIIEIVWGDDM